jgi:hypothetical protein
VETFDEAELHTSCNPSLVIETRGHLGVFGIRASSLSSYLREDLLELDSIELEALLASDTKVL